LGGLLEYLPFLLVTLWLLVEAVLVIIVVVVVVLAVI